MEEKILKKKMSEAFLVFTVKHGSKKFSMLWEMARRAYYVYRPTLV